MLLDEWVDRRLARDILGHDVRTVPESGCAQERRPSRPSGTRVRGLRYGRPQSSSAAGSVTLFHRRDRAAGPIEPYHRSRGLVPQSRLRVRLWRCSARTAGAQLGSDEELQGATRQKEDKKAGRVGRTAGAKDGGLRSRAARRGVCRPWWSSGCHRHHATGAPGRRWGSTRAPPRRSPPGFRLSQRSPRGQNVRVCSGLPRRRQGRLRPRGCGIAVWLGVVFTLFSGGPAHAGAPEDVLKATARGTLEGSALRSPGMPPGPADFCPGIATMGAETRQPFFARRRGSRSPGSRWRPVRRARETDEKWS